MHTVPFVVVRDLIVTSGYELVEDDEIIGCLRSIIRREYEYQEIEAGPTGPIISKECKETNNYVARYITTWEGEWNISSLRHALDHILNFENNVDPLFVSGSKTRDRVHNYDSIMLFRLCQKYDINTDNGSTIPDMECAVRSYITTPKCEMLRELKDRDSKWFHCDAPEEYPDKTWIYQGIHPLASHVNYTIFNAEDVDDVDYDDLITIGELNKPKDLFIMTFDELFEFLDKCKIFLLPNTTSSLMDDDLLNEIGRLAVAAKFDKLPRLISHIKTQMKRSNGYKEKFDDLEFESKELVCKFLKDCGDLGYLSRGWTGDDTLPLEVKDTQSLPDEFDGISDRCSSKMFEILNTYSADHFISSLPLKTCLISGDGQRVFVNVANDDVGLTLITKIGIMFNNPSSGHACIRTSSNYLLYSVYIHMLELFDEEFFDIEKLQMVF